MSNNKLREFDYRLLLRDYYNNMATTTRTCPGNYAITQETQFICGSQMTMQACQIHHNNAPLRLHSSHTLKYIPSLCDCMFGMPSHNYTKLSVKL